MPWDYDYDSLIRKESTCTLNPFDVFLSQAHIGHNNLTITEAILETDTISWKLQIKKTLKQLLDHARQINSEPAGII